MPHAWELRTEETPDSREAREAHAAGVSGPLFGFWRDRRAPDPRFERYWECAKCCMRVKAEIEVSARSEDQDDRIKVKGRPDPGAILSLRADEAVSLNRPFNPSQLIQKRGRLRSRVYLGCEEFTVFAVHRT
jgi:hypothetical protein